MTTVNRTKNYSLKQKIQIYFFIAFFPQGFFEGFQAQEEASSSP
jgi:hypothetical protein